MASGVVYQPGLFGAPEPSFDATFAALQRVHIDDTAWIDVIPGWLTGDERLFEQVLDTRPWAQRNRWMYDHQVEEPRMTARWSLASGEPLEPSILESVRLALSTRYGVVFDSAGFNLYRDGRDSVAWHRDRIRKEIVDPIVPLVCLGEPRKLAFRPRGGGPSRSFPVGRGDLLVTGGCTQRTWEHAIVKVARAGPRISIAFRYGAESPIYTAPRP